MDIAPTWTVHALAIWVGVVNLVTLDIVQMDTMERTVKIIVDVKKVIQMCKF